MDPSGEWIKIFTGLDIGVMMAIAVVAWVCKRAASIKESWALAIPLLLGAVWGGFEALQNGYAPVAFVFKGALMNGAGATVAGRLMDAALTRLGATEPAPAKKDTPPPV